jgi:CubicO group peptidase (beta-lactamase class C family)
MTDHQPAADSRTEDQALSSAPTPRGIRTDPAGAPRRTAAGRRGLVAAALAIAVVVFVSYVATTALSVPAPHTLVELSNTPPSRQGTVFATRVVPSPAQAAPLPVDPQPLPSLVPWKGSTITPEEFLSTTHTQAFLVLRDGVITHEWYGEGTSASTRLSSWSTAKSVVSLLVGQAIADGKLCEQDRLVEILPHLRAGGAYDDITIKHLLDMTSGVDVPESYNSRLPFTGTARMYLTGDLHDFALDHRSTTFTPGSRGSYRSINTELLGQALAAVEGRPLADLLAERLWQPIGAEADAIWSLDHEGGREKAFCCINATARDFAKLGQLVLDGGRVGDEQVVPRAWIERAATPAPHSVEGWGYSAQWWHPTGSDGDFSAVGVYGQYIYINPSEGTVIVKLSDHGTEQDEQETIEVFRAIAGSTGDRPAGDA